MNFLLVNRSTLVPDRAVELIAQAVNVQLNRDVLPAWRRLSCAVVAGKVPLPGDLRIDVVDALDETDVLGYHSEDDKGVISGVVGVRAVLDAGGGILAAGSSGDSVAAVVSHEVLEAKFDPNANLYADTLGASPHGSAMAFELCDPVQASSYYVGQVQVSNFVTPSYFDPHGPGPWDFLRRLPGPFQLEAGGYGIFRAGAQERAVFGGADARPWRTHARGKLRVNR